MKRLSVVVGIILGFVLHLDAQGVSDCDLPLTYLGAIETDTHKQLWVYQPHTDPILLTETENRASFLFGLWSHSGEYLYYPTDDGIMIYSLAENTTIVLPHQPEFLSWQSEDTLLLYNNASVAGELSELIQYNIATDTETILESSTEHRFLKLSASPSGRYQLLETESHRQENNTTFFRQRRILLRDTQTQAASRLIDRLIEDVPFNNWRTQQKWSSDERFLVLDAHIEGDDFVDLITLADMSSQRLDITTRSDGHLQWLPNNSQFVYDIYDNGTTGISLYDVPSSTVLWDYLAQDSNFFELYRVSDNGDIWVQENRLGDLTSFDYPVALYRFDESGFIQQHFAPPNTNFMDNVQLASNNIMLAYTPSIDSRLRTVVLHNLTTGENSTFDNQALQFYWLSDSLYLFYADETASFIYDANTMTHCFLTDAQIVGWQPRN